MSSFGIRKIEISTHGEGFYSIDNFVKDIVDKNLSENDSGILFIFNPHTSCGLTMNESFDSSAREDMEEFLKHLAPRNLKFIKHTSEGPDDSPSHMKSLLVENSLQIPIENGKLEMGTWQGIYLCEFRDSPKNRVLKAKFLRDN